MEPEYKGWSQDWDGFNSELERPGSQAQQERWPKSHFRGVTPLGEPAPPTHQSRLRLNPFDIGLGTLSSAAAATDDVVG